MFVMCVIDVAGFVRGMGAGWLAVRRGLAKGACLLGDDVVAGVHNAGAHGCWVAFEGDVGGVAFERWAEGVCICTSWWCGFMR